MTTETESPATRTEEPQKHQSGARKWLSYLIKYGVPLLVTVLLCKLLFDGVDLDEMWHIITTQCDFRWIALALCISIISHVFRALRWGLQLDALNIRVPLFPLVLSIFGTYSVNLVLPRLGEIWRSGYIAKRQDAPFATVFGSMVADRLADTVTVFLLTVVTFLLATSQLDTYLGQNAATLDKYTSLLTSPWLWAAVVVCCVLVWRFFVWKTQNPVVVKIQNFARGIWNGFAVIVRMPGKGKWLLYTVGLWGCYFVQLYVVFYAFGFTADILRHYGILAALVTFVLSSLSMGVPSNGGIGPWQWSVIFALSLYGLGRGEATAFANLVLGCQTLLLIALGIFTFACISIENHRHKAKAQAN